MPCDYASSRASIMAYITQSNLVYLRNLTPSQLNDLYDQCAWKPQKPLLGSDEERKNKINLLAWMMRNVPSLKHPAMNMPTKQLVDGSIALRDGSQQPVPPAAAAAAAVMTTSPHVQPPAIMGEDSVRIKQEKNAELEALPSLPRAQQSMFEVFFNKPQRKPKPQSTSKDLPLKPQKPLAQLPEAVLRQCNRGRNGGSYHSDPASSPPSYTSSSSSFTTLTCFDQIAFDTDDDEDDDDDDSLCLPDNNSYRSANANGTITAPLPSTHDQLQASENVAGAMHDRSGEDAIMTEVSDMEGTEWLKHLPDDEDEDADEGEDEEHDVTAERKVLPQVNECNPYSSTSTTTTTSREIPVDSSIAFKNEGNTTAFAVSAAAAVPSPTTTTTTTNINPALLLLASNLKSPLGSILTACEQGRVDEALIQSAEVNGMIARFCGMLLLAADSGEQRSTE